MSKANTKQVRQAVTIAIAVAVVAALLDQWSKSWAIANLTDQPPRPLMGDFLSLRLIFNPGAAFSLGEGSTWIFTVISIAVVVGVLWALVTGRITSTVVAVLVGLITGGAIGNLIDRMELIPHSGPTAGFGRGYVIDFIDYNGWFVGNVADIWVVVGVIALAVTIVFFDKEVDEDQVQPIGETGDGAGE